MTMAYELFALPDFPRPSLDLCEPMVPHIKCSPRENVVGSGMHKHRCDCGATWKHSNNIEQGTQEQFDPRPRLSRLRQEAALEVRAMVIEL
jgi:hypothetical protein